MSFKLRCDERGEHVCPIFLGRKTTHDMATKAGHEALNRLADEVVRQFDAMFDESAKEAK
jgi:hypothetical protein